MGPAATPLLDDDPRAVVVPPATPIRPTRTTSRGRCRATSAADRELQVPGGRPRRARPQQCRRTLDGRVLRDHPRRLLRLLRQHDDRPAARGGRARPASPTASCPASAARTASRSSARGWRTTGSRSTSRASAGSSSTRRAAASAGRRHPVRLRRAADAAAERDAARPSRGITHAARRSDRCPADPRRTERHRPVHRHRDHPRRSASLALAFAALPARAEQADAPRPGVGLGGAPGARASASGRGRRRRSTSTRAPWATRSRPRASS